MAECAAIPSYLSLSSRRNYFGASNFMPRKINFERYLCHEKYGIFLPQTTFGRRKQHSKVRCFGLESLCPENISSLNSIADKVLLMASAIGAYVAGVVPSDSPSLCGRKNVKVDSGFALDAVTTAPVNDDANMKNAWNAVNKKLIDALDAIDHGFNPDIEVESGNYIKKRLLSLYALSEGPRLRLLLVTFQKLQEEVRGISGTHQESDENDWLPILSETIQRCIESICLKWLEEEICLDKTKPDKLQQALLVRVLENMKKEDTIQQNIRKSGKQDLYIDLLLFLRFGSLRFGSYDRKLFFHHATDVLEDLIITLADGIMSLYLELFSVDSNFSNDINQLGLSVCPLSTRALQRLRNEVAINQWLQQNIESVVSMYEDRFDLFVLKVQACENPNGNNSVKVHWWKKINSTEALSVPWTLQYVVISYFPLPMKRTAELRSLNGWRYYYSLFLEFSDIALPIVRVIISKVSDAVTFFFVMLIGRSLGLIYTGIRRSLRWR